MSNVELAANSAALNKFEQVFYAIIANVSTPSSLAEETQTEVAPFGVVIRESLAYLATGNRVMGSEAMYEQYSKAVEALMADHSIDIDFKKMIQKYWETFLPEAADTAIIEQKRAEILQWFSGQGSIGQYRKQFGVNKVVSAQNAKVMIQSLAGFVRLAGYKGLLILFDEAEMSYSVMRKSALREAHNNLLSLINNIESLTGLFLIYATTPDFFTDPKHGIVIYGALAGRIGRPMDDRSPRALDTIWNFDLTESGMANYQAVAIKIRDVYAAAYPGVLPDLPSESEIHVRVTELYQMHPSLSSVRFWRPLVTALIQDFDDHLEGEVRPTEKIYDDVMDRLRED